MKKLIKYALAIFACLLVLGLAIALADLVAEVLTKLMCGAFEGFMQIVDMII